MCMDSLGGSDGKEYVCNAGGLGLSGIGIWYFISPSWLVGRIDKKLKKKKRSGSLSIF